MTHTVIPMTVVARARMAPEKWRLIQALLECVNAMSMQIGRESGLLHINSATAHHIFVTQALEPAKALLDELGVEHD